jgi:hypothetical protein
MDKTDNNKKAVIEALQDCHGIVTDACKKTGVARSTFYQWLNEDAGFKAAVEEAQEQAIDFVEGKLFQKINGVKIGKLDDEGELNVYEQPPSDTAIIFYLKTKAKKRGYIERQELTGADGGPINHDITLKL